MYRLGKTGVTLNSDRERNCVKWVNIWSFIHVNNQYCFFCMEFYVNYLVANYNMMSHPQTNHPTSI